MKTRDYEKAKRRIAERIRDARAASGLTLTAAAETAGITKAYLCDIGHGRKNNPSAETILRLADALGVSPAFLLTGERE